MDSWYCWSGQGGSGAAGAMGKADSMAAGDVPPDASAVASCSSCFFLASLRLLQ